jgi:predicted DNA-binding ribbon-helix-helix protein
VKIGEGMKTKKGEVKAKSMKPGNSASTVRATITFPTELHTTLEEIAKQRKVSLAWVVREATEQYLAEKWPLLRGQG